MLGLFPNSSLWANMGSVTSAAVAFQESELLRVTSRLLQRVLEVIDVWSSDSTTAEQGQLMGAGTYQSIRLQKLMK